MSLMEFSLYGHNFEGMWFSVMPCFKHECCSNTALVIIAEYRVLLLNWFGPN